MDGGPMINPKLVDANGRRVAKRTRRDPDGTWSSNVWEGGVLSPVVTNVQRHYGFASRDAARAADVAVAPPGRIEHL